MPDELNALPLPDLYQRLAATGLIRRLLELAREEDLGPELLDITSASVGIARPREQVASDGSVRASLVFREGGVGCGLAAMSDLAAIFGGGVEIEPLIADGMRIDPGQTVAVLTGENEAILRLERTLLNLIARLSGVATLTAQYVERVRVEAPDVPARILDTRKTTPGLRLLEKYAVRCGGGLCHRFGLYDAVLIKDNHLAGLSPSEIAALVRAAAQHARGASVSNAEGRMPNAAPPEPRFIEIEADTLDQLDALLTLPGGTIDIVLLDNMTPEQLREAVARRDRADSDLLLEASGGVRLESIGEIAASGVDRISVGALTHQATSLDVALDMNAD